MLKACCLLKESTEKIYSLFERVFFSFCVSNRQLVYILPRELLLIVLKILILNAIFIT